MDFILYVKLNIGYKLYVAGYFLPPPLSVTHFKSFLAKYLSLPFGGTYIGLHTDIHDK